MRRTAAALVLIGSMIPFLFGQKAADPTQRYFRLICLVHLTGSGKDGDPIIPEYVAEGTATAQAAIAAAAATAKDAAAASSQHGEMTPRAASPNPTGPSKPVSVVVPLSMSSRPGFLAWAMQKSDDGRMAIVHIVAADMRAFDGILNDKRPEVRAFLIGRDTPEEIEKELRHYKQDFRLADFNVRVQ